MTEFIIICLFLAFFVCLPIAIGRKRALVFFCWTLLAMFFLCVGVFFLSSSISDGPQNFSSVRRLGLWLVSVPVIFFIAPSLGLAMSMIDLPTHSRKGPQENPYVEQDGIRKEQKPSQKTIQHVDNLHNRIPLWLFSVIALFIALFVGKFFIPLFF